MLTSLTLFDFSKIKSEYVFQLSEYNSFNYEFSESDSYNAKNDDNNSQTEDPAKYYIKKVNMTIPSNEKLKEESFRDEFFTNYNTSFANFCGLNEKMFKEIYDKNQYIPSVNKMGDITMNIDNIIKNLDEFSEHKRLKIHRSVIKKDKKINIKEKNDKFIPKLSLNIFQESKGKSNINSDNCISLEENNLDDQSKSSLTKSSRKNKNKNEMGSPKSINNSNNEISSKEGDIENKPRDKTLLNIKRKLKNISIIGKKEDAIKFKIKNESKEKTNVLSEKELNENNQSYVPNNNLILSNDIPFKSSNQQESSNLNKNNIFNFSSNTIKDLTMRSLKKEKLFTPMNFFEQNDNIGGNINFKLLQNNSFLSPFSFHQAGFHSILSPNFSVNSPYNVNIFFNDSFNFKNSDVNNDEEALNNNKTNNNDEAVNPNDKDKMKKSN